MRETSLMDYQSSRMMPTRTTADLPADLFMSSLTAAAAAGAEAPPRSTSQKKYSICCLICGSFSMLLAIMFYVVYYLIRTHTFTGYFETVPTYLPASMLFVLGSSILCFSKRQNRHPTLIYIVGVGNAVCAITCTVVTITTRYFHMSRLQDLNLNCEYKITTRICTCYSDSETPQNEGRKFLFDAVADCRVAQGDLYSCFQAIYGLSMVGIVVALISCLLSYMLFGHERKKLYWEELDMHCRLMHASHFRGGRLTPNLSHHHHNNNHRHQQHLIAPPSASVLMTTNNNNSARSNSNGDQNSCGFCEHCHNHQAAIVAAGYPTPPQIHRYPWINGADITSNNDSKFLTLGPGTGGGGIDQNNIIRCPGHEQNNLLYENLYAALPQTTTTTAATATATTGPPNNCSSGWRWPRMRWQRNNDFNLVQQAQLLSSTRQGSDFLNAWTNYMQSSLSSQSPPAAAAAQQCINGYPIGMWGPPPPPYTDPLNLEWQRPEYSINNHDINSQLLYQHPMDNEQSSIENNNNNNNNININNNNSSSCNNLCQSIPNLNLNHHHHHHHNHEMHENNCSILATPNNNIPVPPVESTVETVTPINDNDK